MISTDGHGPWVWLAPLAASIVLCLIATPVAIRVARHFGIIDEPVGMKIHTRATPLLGGTAIYVAFLVACILFLPLRGPVLGIILGGGVAVVIGVIDDRFKLSPLVHLAGQIVAALAVMVAGLGALEQVSNPFMKAYAAGASLHIPMALGIAFTLFWLVGMMNTVNFLDGLDGLATGVCAITAILLALWVAVPLGQRTIATSSSQYHHADLVLPVILAGCLIGFLPYNWHPARVFLGDSGALFLGLALASIAIMGPKIGTALLVLVIPVLDVAWAIVRRRLRGKSFLSGDKQHVYHRMIELGMSQTQVVLSLLALCSLLALADLFLVRIYKFMLVGLVAGLTIAGLITLEIAANRKNKPNTSAPPPTKKIHAEAPG